MIRYSDQLLSSILRRGPVLIVGIIAAASIAYSFYSVDPSVESLSIGALPPDSTDLPPLIPDVDELQRDTSAAISIDTTRDIVTGPFGETSAGLTVGERLKRLDSLMLVVPADSLGSLMARYEDLLDSALMLQTSAPDRTYAAENRERTQRSNESADVKTSEITIAATQQPARPVQTKSPTAPSIDIAEVSNTSIIPASPPSNQSAEPVPTTTDPTRPVRQSDAAVLNRRSNSGYVRSVPLSQRRSNDNWASSNQNNGTSSVADSEAKRSNSSTSTTSRRSNASSIALSTPSEPATDRVITRSKKRRSEASGSGVSRSHRTTGKQKRRGMSSSRAGTSERVRSTTSSLKRKYTEGLARFRAGDYRRAIEKLTPVARSTQPYRYDARYYLAVAQERTGNLKAALGNYRSLRKMSGGIGEKAWIAHARLLVRSGKRSEAKQQLLQFTRSRGSSRYMTEAQKMLKGL